MLVQDCPKAKTKLDCVVACTVQTKGHVRRDSNMHLGSDQAKILTGPCQLPYFAQLPNSLESQVAVQTQSEPEGMGDAC